MLSEAYFELLKNTLTDYHRIDRQIYTPVTNYTSSPKSQFLKWLDKTIYKRQGYRVCHPVKQSYEKRQKGLDWPIYADSMIGLLRMENIEYCIRQIIQDSVPGDFIETGVWRGGACIFMNAFNTHLKLNRTVWVADSFEGLPKPNEEKYKEDAGDTFYTYQELAVSMEQVKANFEKYGLLNEHVRFLKGWFKDTLPSAPIEKLALIRLDGDMYESTMDGLNNLYHKLSDGGFLIVDDYFLAPCRKAIEDFRQAHHINDRIIDIDGSGVYWRKGSGS